MNALLFGTLVTIGCITFSIIGMVIVRKKISIEALKVDHEVATALIAVLGTLYAIVLGLVVVDALGHREQAELMESNEANALATILHLVRSLSVDQRKPIMQAELDYCNAAIEHEWPKLQDGSAPDDSTLDAFNALWEKTTTFDPKNDRETNLHSSLLSAVTDFSNARRYRIVACRHGLPALLWLILIVGGISTIVFTYFFAAERLKLQALMTSIVAMMLSLNILLVYFYGTPYRGDLHVEPTGLEHVRRLLQQAPILQKQ